MPQLLLYNAVLITGQLPINRAIAVSQEELLMICTLHLRLAEQPNHSQTANAMTIWLVIARSLTQKTDSMTILLWTITIQTAAVWHAQVLLFRSANAACSTLLSLLLQCAPSTLILSAALATYLLEIIAATAQLALLIAPSAPSLISPLKCTMLQLNRIRLWLIRLWLTPPSWTQLPLAKFFLSLNASALTFSMAPLPREIATAVFPELFNAVPIPLLYKTAIARM